MTAAENKKQKKPIPIGGQAVMEGVMMRGTDTYSIAVRHQKTDEIVTSTHPVKLENKGFAKLPIIRGIVSFISSLVLGVGTIYESAEMAGLDDFEEENPSKFEKFLTDKFGDKLYGFVMTFSVIIAVVMSLVFFILLPTWLMSLLKPYIAARTLRSILEGVIRICIFIVYLSLVSLAKEIKRVYMYHGAEHKTINCFESGDSLNVENVRKHTRFHKRCGTSFLLIVMLVSMIFFFFMPFETVLLKSISRLVLMPLIAGVSYEIIRFAGKSDNIIVRAVSYPGICLQRITTKEPDDSMIEVAIAALNLTLGIKDEQQS